MEDSEKLACYKAAQKSQIRPNERLAYIKGWNDCRAYQTVDRTNQKLNPYLSKSSARMALPDLKNRLTKAIAEIEKLMSKRRVRTK